MKRILLLALALMLCLWGNDLHARSQLPPAVGCPEDYDDSNGPVISWSAEFRLADAVLIGTVISEKDIFQPDPNHMGIPPSSVYKLKVNALLKGKVASFVEVSSPNDFGRLPLPHSEGSRYVLFLYDFNGSWMESPCGNSAKLVQPAGALSLWTPNNGQPQIR